MTLHGFWRFYMTLHGFWRFYMLYMVLGGGGGGSAKNHVKSRKVAM